EIPVGAALNLIELSADGNHILLSLDLEGLMAEGEDVTVLPNVLSVSIEDLQKLDLSLVEITDFDGGFGSYLVPEELAGRGGKVKMTYCLADVRVFATSKCKAKVARPEFA